jgi:PhzF family phenazine biosynthesis protein
VSGTGSGRVALVDAEVLHPLRLEVLRPGQPPSSVAHDYDHFPESVHVAAFTETGEVGACASFYREPYADGREAWRLRAMASAPKVRGKGYGAQALLFGIDEVRRRGGSLIWCNARSGAVGFYEHLGFQTVGDEFDIPEIGPHFVMVLEPVADPEVLRYAAFTDGPRGGNPAGVVLEAGGLDAAAMQRIAADVGYSETAFLSRRPDGSFGVRYFAPEIEVPFCGHATIATGVALGERFGPGRYRLQTPAGEVPVDVRADAGGFTATLTSVPPDLTELAGSDLDALLGVLRWQRDDLDAGLPPRVAYAGAWHPVLAVRTRERLADLDYDVDAARALMLDRGWTTLQLVWRETATVFHVRDPFPVGGVVEDPATGAAAAAFGHYLRELRLVDLPASLTLHQGADLGRPSLLIVDVDDETPGVRVSGQAVRIEKQPPARRT